MRKIWWCALILLLPAMASAGTLQQDLHDMANAFHGHVALYAKDLRTGKTVEIDPDQEVATASVIKLPVMIETMYQVKEGKLKLDRTVTLKDSDKVEGSGILQFLDPGLNLTLNDTVGLMMMLSDNTAANLTMEAAGIPNVNARLKQMGMKHTYLYKEVFRPATGPMPPDQKKFGLGKTTAREMAEIMESVARCDLGDTALCHKMIYFMTRQENQDLLARDLQTVPSSEQPLSIAAKLGELNAVRNEVALIDTPGGQIVISYFTWDNRDQQWSPENEAEVLAGKIARRIVDEWGKKPAAK